jgi:homoserine O-acetyltransferase/O-succinyltransferase
LRIEQVHAIVGSSYGGMVAQHFAAWAPQRCGRLIALAAADRSQAQASALRHVQRCIVELGLQNGTQRLSLALARSLAMTTYRSPQELQDRFAGGYDDAELVAWLQARGAAFASEWGAEQFLCLNRSIDAHRIDAASIRVPTWLLAFDSDQLVPAADIRRLALALPDLRGHREFHSRFGHDAFLKEVAIVSGFVKEALR